MRSVAITIAMALLPVAIFALVGCSTLAPDVWVTNGEKYPISWSDVREIERLLPALGIGRPINRIDMEGPDRATVSCLTRPLDIERADNEIVSFTVMRRNGRWVAIDKPVKGPLNFTI
jgi:hypothetical protein